MNNKDVPSQPERTELLQSLLERFAISDLKLICFNLAVEYEDLPGESRKDKARELIQYMERHGRLPELATAIESWPFPKGVGGEIVGPLTLRDRALDGLLKNVQATWIDGVLYQSLPTAVLLQLGLAYAPHAIARSQPYVLRQAEQPDTPVDKSIIELFDAHGRNLLILGAPGSGKTFTLLQLAEMLIQQAEVDPRLPVPIVLNLSSWADKRGTLLDWAALEMNTQYQAARKVSRTWLEQNELVLLLDGLDEVDEKFRDDCITAINEFKVAHTVDVVVCSRSADYERLQKQLNLNVAVTIQPVTEAEIDRYLAQEELELQAVRATLKTDADMRELSKSPLMLTIMTMAYRGMSREELRPLQSIAARRHHLFKEYVARVFERLPLTGNDFYEKGQALQWLSNLAKNMQREKASVFFIEQLQPTWLDSYRPYMGLVGLVGGIASGFTLSIFYEMNWWLGGGLELVIALTLSGAISGISSGILCVKASRDTWRFFIIIFVYILVFGLLFNLIEEIVYWARYLSPQQFYWLKYDFDKLINNMGDGITFGLIVGLPSSLLSYKRHIDPVEQLTIYFPSLRQLVVNFSRALLIGSIIGAIIASDVDFYSTMYDYLILGKSVNVQKVEWLLEITTYTIAFWGVVFGLWGIFFSTIQIRPIKNLFKPNLSIRNSIVNAFSMLLRGGFYSYLAMKLSEIFLAGNEFTFVSVLYLGILASFFYYGGSTVIKHYVLRFLLARKKTLPFRLVPFLDGMAAHILLRKVSGGYIFIHRMLLEYFAELETEG